MAVTFTGNMSGPSGIAADASGNIWIANQTGNTITELSQKGTLLSGTGYTNSLSAPTALAFDPSGNLWVTSQGDSTLSKFSSSGVPATNSPYTGGNMASSTGIAFDSAGNGWISNGGTLKVTEVIPGSGNTPTFTSFSVAGGIHAAVAVNPH
jgi:streptogramin lyase